MNDFTREGLEKLRASRFQLTFDDLKRLEVILDCYLGWIDDPNTKKVLDKIEFMTAHHRVAGTSKIHSENDENKTQPTSDTSSCFFCKGDCH